MARSKCYTCVHRKDIPGDSHSRCQNLKAKVTGNIHGIKNNWFFWPFNFDPIWLMSCNGFSDNPKDKLPDVNDPLADLLSLLRR
jgi:hypothetical protein